MIKSNCCKILFLLLFYTTHTFGADRPNVLLIIADDLGVDAINGYGVGTDLPNTPNIDKLREMGVTFTNTWAAPVCAATRASLITGKYGVNNGVNTLPGNLTPKHKTIFTEISEIAPDYATCLVGKWHLAKANNALHPNSHGVGDYMGVLGNGVEDYYKWNKVEDGAFDTCETYVTTYLTDYAIDWINEQTSPWFMWLAHLAPHSPYHVVPEHMSTSESSGSVKDKFKGMIESLDYEVGRLLDSIPEDVLSNTVIMFIGDNGTAGNVLQGFPAKRGKESLYQGGVNVPMIVSGYGVTRENDTEDALVNVSDFYVTIAQIIDGAAFPDDVAFDGVSFKHLLDSTEGIERELNYMELGANNSIPEDIYTVSNGQYKVLDLGTSGVEMYDLSADFFELSNLLVGDLTAEQVEVKDYLISEMDAIRGFSSEPDTGSTPVESIEVGTGNYKIVHTGVSEFYDEAEIISTPDINDTLYGQDAGRVINTPSYTDNGDGTVSDNVTGLMWQQNMGDKMNYVDAVVAANACDLGGYSDWRIPTIKELYSLILFTGRVFGETAETLFIDVDYFDQPIGDTSIGDREIDAQTWSSTHYTSLTMNGDSTVFGVNFVDGRIKGYAKYKKATGAANTMYFRLVRGNEEYGINAFNDNSDGTVTDSATTLMWQQADDGAARDWVSSVSYCESLSLASHDDWHLPTAKELHSILDYSRSPDATNSAAIDPVFSVTSIDDAEGNAGHYPYFWTTSPHKDGPTPYASAVYIAFGEANGQMNGTLMDVHGAGAQRSDPKAGDAADYPIYHGPQGDVQRVYNHCRCVRSLSHTTALDPVQFSSESLSVYPNPTDNNVTIELAVTMTSVNYSVCNISGVTLLNGVVSASENQVQLGGLDSGVYYFIFQSSDEQLLVKKIVKL